MSELRIVYIAEALCFAGALYCMAVLWGLT